MSKKSLVFDASVLLHDPDSIHHYPNEAIVLPSVVIEELDQKKHLNNETGKNARYVMRLVDNLSKRGNISDGVRLENGALIKILLDEEHKKKKNGSNTFTPDRNRHRLLAMAFQLQQEGEKITLISKDPVTKILAETVGIVTENYRCVREHYDTLHKGIKFVEAPKAQIDKFYMEGHLPIPEGEFFPNEYLVLKSEENSSAVARVDGKTKTLVPLTKAAHDIWGIKPRNIEQKCAMDLLTRDDVKLVVFTGGAGTGKTLLALAAGLRKVFDEGVYSRIMIARSIIPVGRDIGFLPGTKEEKLRAWLAPFFDNLEFICSSSGSENGMETKKWILESEKFQVEAITYMRGRSFTNTYVIIDEAQNLTPHEIKTIISRVGDNTKIIVLGDPSQIDNPYLDADSNGLVYLVGRMKKHDIFGSIYFQQTERSKLAAIAAAVL
jgi:PhoH-like ATPase